MTLILAFIAGGMFGGFIAAVIIGALTAGAADDAYMAGRLDKVLDEAPRR